MMPKRCCVQNCSNQPKSGVALHKFPSDKLALLTKWVEFVNIDRANFIYTQYMHICSAHFRQPEDYDNWTMFSMGYDKALKLKLNVVPSIRPIIPEKRRLTTSPYDRPIKVSRRSRARQKLEINRILVMILYCTHIVACM